MLIYPFSIFWLKLTKSVFTYFRRVTLVFTLSFLKGLPNSTKYTPQVSEKRNMSKSSHMTVRHNSVGHMSVDAETAAKTPEQNRLNKQNCDKLVDYLS